MISSVGTDFERRSHGFERTTARSCQVEIGETDGGWHFCWHERLRTSWNFVCSVDPRMDEGEEEEEEEDSEEEAAMSLYEDVSALCSLLLCAFYCAWQAMDEDRASSLDGSVIAAFPSHGFCQLQSRRDLKQRMILGMIHRPRWTAGRS